ncbi:MAG: META domain-containing protein [Acidobacteria bacterium]|nr:META domain-containing protein [Acidobacteriota bacterium]
MNQSQLVLLALAAVASPLWGQEARYACPAGEVIDVTYLPEKTTPRGAKTARAVVRMEGKPKLVLPQVISGSGARFSDGYTTLWNKGREVMLEAGSINVNGCTQTGSEAVSEAPPPSLVGRWTLVALEGNPIPARATAPFLEFPAKGDRMAGYAGCNRFGGSYVVGRDSIEFRQIFSTKMACLEEGGQVESQFLDLLSKVSNYSVTNGELQLLDSSGALLLKLRAH